MIRTIIAGDSYINLRSLQVHELVAANGEPLNLSGCKIKTSYKVKGQEEVVLEHSIQIDEVGTVLESNGLDLEHEALDGILKETLTSVESRSLPVGVELVGDFQLETDQDVVTWFQENSFLVVADISTEGGAE